MGKLDRLLKDGLCPLEPMWNALLVLEFTFLVLLGFSLFLTPGRPSVVIYFSLAFIVPTTAILLGLLYYCKRVEKDDPFRRENDTGGQTEDDDRSRGGDVTPPREG